MFFKKDEIPSAENALVGRAEVMPVAPAHAVLATPMDTGFESKELMMVGLGCFWGAERKFWQAPGVYSTAVGYAAGHTPNPTYQEVCSGQTGHNEVVRVVFDPQKTSYKQLLQVFWESHNPTQGMRQGNDRGTQYRSGIYFYSPEQEQMARSTQEQYQVKLTEAGFGRITTEILPAPAFYFAEDYHQQYLHKNPGGYCGLGGTGITCPVGVEID